ncbi:MAG: hypothetical protein KAW12_04125 [Candidatus Aminicenantes bacterium]|nr:hypothetical protein [Candidatus Aminicenantes bacterium]
MEEKQLHVIIKQAVDEAFKENITRLKVAMIPTVDDEEMDEIRDLFGNPGDYESQEFSKIDI